MKQETDKITERIIGELSQIERDGMGELLKFLQTSDYLTCPASTKFHEVDDGGLALHSWTVFRLLKHKNQFLNLGLPEDTVRITGLLHDLCKVDTYVPGKKWIKNESTNNKWEQIPKWKVVDNEPYGHGEKSIIMIQNHIKLTRDEILLIRWHMNGWTSGIHIRYPLGYAYDRAVELCPAVIAIACADQEARLLTEVGEDD